MTGTNKVLMASIALVGGVGSAIYLTSDPSSIPIPLPAGANPYSPIPFRVGTVGADSYHQPFCPYAKKSLTTYGVTRRINFANMEQITASKRKPCTYCQANVVSPDLPLRVGIDGSNLYHLPNCWAVQASWAKYGIAKRLDLFDWSQIKASKRIADEKACNAVHMIEISGFVRDEKGNPVPGVTITATPAISGTSLAK